MGIEVAESRLDWIHKNLLLEWSRRDVRNRTNLHAIEQLLNQFARELRSKEIPMDDKARIVLHKDLLEISLFHALLVGSESRFEECLAEVEEFYRLTACESVSRNLVNGLRLMYLLSRNRMADFHAVSRALVLRLAEQLDLLARENDPFISTVLRFECYTMQGSYKKLVTEGKALPSALYSPLYDALMDRVRCGIATCIEKSHEKLNLRDATTKLLFPQSEHTRLFATERGWLLDGDQFKFDGEVCRKSEFEWASTELTPAHVETNHLIRRLITYAKELETIV